jgi:hypothetical protein
MGEQRFDPVLRDHDVGVHERHELRGARREPGVAGRCGATGLVMTDDGHLAPSTDFTHRCVVV